MERQTITVDIAPGNSQVERLGSSQGDIGRPLGVYIIQNGVALNCSTYSAELYILKPDGKFYTTQATVDSTETNLIKWDTAEQETPVAGACAAQIRIAAGDDDIGTARFVEFVEASPCDMGSASESEVALLTEYVRQARESAESAGRDATTASGAASSASGSASTATTAANTATQAATAATAAADRAEAVEESIPADYSQLSDDVSGLKSALGQDIEDIPLYSTGNYGIAINGNTVAVNNGEFYLTSFGSAYNVYICECEEGDAFILDGKGGSYQARLWGFVASFTSADTQADVISVCSATDSATGLDSGVLYAPSGAAWAVFQLKEGAAYKVGKGMVNYVTNGISPVDTKATEALNGINGVKESLLTAIDAGYASAVCGTEVETDTGRATHTNSGTSGGSAYWNGAVIPNFSKVTGVILSDDCTATNFQLFAFDRNWNLLSDSGILTPTITDHKFALDTPIILQDGGQILMAFRNLTGNYYYSILTQPTLKEWGINGRVLSNSTVKLCVDFAYETIESVEFEKNTARMDIGLDDFTMPKIREASGEYTLIGRWFDWTVDGVTKKAVNNGGQSILFRVKGASIINISWGVRRSMTTPPYIAYAIDGAAWVRQSIDTQTIALPDTNEHFVWIVLDGINLSASGANRWDGGVICYLDSLSVDAGTMQACEPINKKILFVGDSIVEGVNVLGDDDDSTVYSAVNEFSFRTAKKLNAFPLLCGYGGSTSWSGLGWVEYSRNGVPVASLDPDIVLIEYGYNDASVIAGGTRTVQEFIDAYTELIEKLSVMYPGAPIICLIPFKQSLAQYIRQVAAEFSFCYVIETSGYNVTYTDTAHPNVQGATTIANHLSGDILNLTGKGFFL